MTPVVVNRSYAASYVHIAVVWSPVASDEHLRQTVSQKLDHTTATNKQSKKKHK